MRQSMETDHDGSFRSPSQTSYTKHGVQTPFERAMLEQIESIGDTVALLASAIESIELKLDEFVRLRGGKSRPTPLSQANNNLSGPILEPPAPDSVLNVYDHDDSAAFLSLTTKQPQTHERQSEKLLMNALNQILVSLPSQYDDVTNVYEEIKLFVALIMNLIPDITPQGIISQALMPYLRLATGRSPSLHSRIWNEMSTVTGCNEEEIRRTFKRMIDTHCRGFRRKIMPLEQFPTSMLRLMKWLKTNVLNQPSDNLELRQMNSE